MNIFTIVQRNSSTTKKSVVNISFFNTLCGPHYLLKTGSNVHGLNKLLISRVSAQKEPKLCGLKWPSYPKILRMEPMN